MNQGNRAMLAMMVAVVPVGARAADVSPVAHVAAYDDAVLSVMKAKLPFKTRIARFEDAVGDYYDMPGIAALVVGPAWAASPPTDRAAAIAALTHHSAVSLAQNFKTFGGERFIVDPTPQPRGPAMVVKLTIASSGSSDTLYFRLDKVGRRWRIGDVISGGVSQTAVLRADLASTVASGGAAGLAKRLAQVDAKAEDR